MMTGEDVLKWIEQSTDTEINEILKAAIRRYEIRFPEWEVMFISIPKGEGRKEAVEQTVGFLEKYLKI